MPNSPTIVAASLDSKDLETAIANLVNSVNTQTNAMAQNFTTKVGEMQQALQALGETKNAKGISGSVGNLINDEEALKNATKETTASVKEQGMSFAEIANALRVAIGQVKEFNSNRLTTLPNKQDYASYERNLGTVAELNEKLKQSALELATNNEKAFKFDAKRAIEDVTAVDKRYQQLTQDLRELEKQSQKDYSSRLKEATKLPTGTFDETIAKLRTLRELLTEGRQTEFITIEQERRLKEVIGSTIQVGKEQRNNIQTAREYSEEIKRQADAIRNNAEFQKTGFYRYYDSASGQEMVVDASRRKSIEEQIIEHQQVSIRLTQVQKENEEAIAYAQNESAKATKQQIENEQRLYELEERRLETAKKKYTAPIMSSPNTETADVFYKAIAHKLNVDVNEVLKPLMSTDSFDRLTRSLQQFQSAYNRMTADERESPIGKYAAEQIQLLEKALKSINSEKSKMSFNSILGLDESSLENISFKTQMLRSYAQSINTTTEEGRNQVRLVADETERLAAKAKELQQSTKSIQSEVNSTKLDNISKMPSDNIGEVGRKIKEVKAYIKELQTQPFVDEKNLRRAQGLFDSLVQKAEKLNRVSGSAKSINNALKMPEQTLGQIAEKVQRLQAILQNLNIDKQGKEIDTIKNKLSELSQKEDEVMGKNRQAIEINNALGRSWNYMKNRLAFYFTVGASTSFVKQLIDIRGQYELLERSIGILVDSAQHGTQIFSQLNSMALKSPFTTMELGAAAKQLVAYDVAAKDVVDTTRRLGDMAAAVGIPIERLTYALGQIKAYGYLNARDARMFANAGIPLVKELADRYTELEGRLVSTADVYDRIKKKAISYEDVMETVNKMTDEGGKFFNFQEKTADTLKVKIANLTLAWNNMLNQMGKDNQGVLGGMLKITKDIFLKWRDIENLLTSVVLTIGLMKAAQILYLAITSKVLTATRALAILQVALGRNAAANLASIGSSFMKFVSNPVMLATAAIAALGIALGKMALDYKDLQKESKALNKSIADNAEENIKSIDKFFDEYRSKLDRIDGESNTDQQKMWERISDEIDKSTKNAKQFIKILEEIDNISDRIKAGEAVLEQEKEIEKEVKRLAELEVFSVGGGFANEALADNMQELTEYANELVNKYGNIEKAEEKLSKASYVTTWSNYKYALKETEEELENFVSKLDKANIARIMGDDPNTQLANIRSFANIVRDSYLATEKGQNITTEGQARLNAYLDAWISKQALANGVIKSIDDGINNWSATEVAAIENNRTAWEAFFDQLKGREKERLDYLIKTNQIGSDEFREIWDKATETMSENAMTSYELIKSQIKDLRETPDIVINVVYKQTEEKEIDKQRERYTKEFIDPSIVQDNIQTAEEYFKKRDENVRKYGSLIKKEGEDNVEWEKRLGQTYQDNRKSIESLTNQLAKSAKMSEVDREAKQDELDTLTAQQEALEIIRKDQNFNYDQFEKGRKKSGSKKDTVLETLKQEISLVEKLQCDYDKLTKSGASQTDALASIRSAYSKTIQQLNAQLRGIGLPQLTTQLITGKDPNKALEYFKDTLAALVQKGLLNLERSKELEAVIEKLTISAKTYNLDKITKGLNNELEKLKDEYELAVELDANPELGSVFMELFDIDPNELPNTIEKYAQNITDKLNEAIAERGDMIQLPNIFDLKEDDMKAFEEMANSEILNKESFEELKKKWAEIRNLRKKDAEDTVKQTKDLQYKLADTDGKILIEKEKLAILEQKLDKETDEKKRELLRLQIEDQKNAIAKLGEEVLQMLPTYRKLFNSIFEHSAGVTRRIAKQWKAALESAKKNADGRYTVTDPQNGKTATITSKEYGKELDRVNGKLRETENSFAKINNAFKGGKDDEKDYRKGIELIGQEAKKAADGLRAVAEIITGLSGDDAEELNDIADALSGIGDVTDGYAKLATDPIGGATQMIKGAWTAISAFIDNSDKKIQQKIKDSERAVKELEYAYIDLEHAVERAYGTSVIGAKQLTIANKELQLQEMKRQLQLEESRKSKNRDEDRILDLKKQIKELQYELIDATRELVDDLMGTDVGGFAENLVSSMISAFKQGEDYMKVFEDSFDNMIDNMIMKSIVSRVVEQRLNDLWDALENRINERSKEAAEAYAAAQAKSMSLDEEDNWAIAMRMTKEAGVKGLMNQWEYARKITQEQIDEYKAAAKDNEQAAAALYNAKKEITGGDIQDMMNMVSEIMPELGERLKEILGEYYKFGQDSEIQLSALQQGIQGITEDTAGALEAYMNSVNQQVYLQSDLLTQIRDVVVGIDFDVQTATQAQMLLQLQQSYTVQMAIQAILTSVLTPSGRAFTVELAS